MKTFCIDIGNTNIHFGLVNKKEIISTGNFPTKALANGPSNEFASSIKQFIDPAERISYCSVVPSINNNLEVSLKSEKPIFHLTCETCIGLNLIYPKPEEIGQDRIANAIAAQAYYGIPAIIIDMGTAVTFDIISSSGYEGGIIAPGLTVMTRYLHEQTALLPELKSEDLLGIEGAIGKSTIHAMKLGVAVGFSGMIDALLVRVLQELKERGEPEPIVLSTGGSIANLTREWAHKSLFVENLTLQGLAVATERAK